MYCTFDKRKWKNPPFFLFLDRFKITMVLLTVIVITAGIVLASAFQAKGNSNSRYKYYKSVEINPGDTLWSIAGNYITDEYSSMDAYINEVKYINSMGDTVITAGSSIIIPYYTGDYKVNSILPKCH